MGPSNIVAFHSMYTPDNAQNLAAKVERSVAGQSVLRPDHATDAGASPYSHGQSPWLLGKPNQEEEKSEGGAS